MTVTPLEFFLIGLMAVGIFVFFMNKWLIGKA